MDQRFFASPHGTDRHYYLEPARICRKLFGLSQAAMLSWLAEHQEIDVISRDRGGGYAKALPHAVQVADRWHLMENANVAFLKAVRKSMSSAPE